MLLLTMVTAIVLSAVVQAVRQAPPRADDAQMFVIVLGTILGMIVGVFVALAHYRWFVAIPLGAVVGLVIGWVTGVLLAVPAGLPMLLAGCPLIVLFAVAVRYLSRPREHESAWSDRSPPASMTLPAPPQTLPEAEPPRSDRPWDARWDTPAAGVPRRFGMGILMLLMTLSAVLFSVLRTVGAGVEVFVVISTMFAAVALGQIVLFGGRYPRAASIWVGACFFPLQAIALCLWMLFETGYRSSQSPAQLFLLFGMLLLISIPIGAAFGYLSGGLVGGVFLILDSLAKRQRPPSDAIEPAEPQEPTNDIQG
jgi:MFS family permease